MNTVPQKKLGLAFSGASSRSIFYIGFLEVLKENNISVSYISACSSASIVAASYACGTLPELKKMAMGLNKEVIFGLLEKRSSKTGLYGLDKVEEYISTFTKGLNFEQVTPQMGFVAVDIEKGEQVVLSMGSLAHAARISCTMPGLFEPVKWGSKILIDGGLLSIIPGDVAKRSGVVDVVVGIDMRGNRHLFTPGQIVIRRFFNRLKKIFVWKPATKMFQKMFNIFEDTDFVDYFSDAGAYAQTEEYPGLFTILGRSLDLAILAQKKHDPKTATFDCDLVIKPDIPKANKFQKFFFTHLTNFNNSQVLYDLGRSSALKNLPKIRTMLHIEENSESLKENNLQVQHE